MAAALRNFCGLFGQIIPAGLEAHNVPTTRS
jgi:hypothetical protein